MVSAVCYVPVLKSKESECLALRRLQPELKPLIMPLFEIQSRATPHLLQRTVTQIEKSWEKSLPMFIDVDSKYLSTNENEALNNLSATLERTRTNSYVVLPVTGLQRKLSYQNLIKSVVKKDKNGVGIRLEHSDWVDLVALNKKISDVVTYLDTSLKNTYIILDFGAFVPEQSGTFINSAISIINNLEGLNSFCNVIIIGTAFPSSPVADSGIVKRIERSEWLIWLSLKKAHDDKKLNRLPIFGDYTTVHPKALIDIEDFRKLKVLPKVKYTSKNEWLFIRESSKLRHDYSKFYDVCKLLVSQKEYYGQEYSWGDKLIYKCSISKSSSGPKTWTTIGINHHLAVATRQCSSYT